MRQLSDNERILIAAFASKIERPIQAQLLEDLGNASVNREAPDGAIVGFVIAGYERPPYRGQHSFGVEGKMLDDDGGELSVALYADENGRLLELEFLRWDSGDVRGPRWETLQMWS